MEIASKNKKLLSSISQNKKIRWMRMNNNMKIL